MQQYQELLAKVRNEGLLRPNRTGIDTYATFGTHFECDMLEGFPIITTKRIFWKGVFHELLWMIRGDDDIKYLQRNGVKYWNPWADEDGYVGPMYGYQWRHWGDDQLKQIVERIKTNPDDRRLLVSAWNCDDLPKMALPPCHLLFQFYVSENTFLDIQVYQRSADMFLGVPFDITLYALLNALVANDCGLIARYVKFTFGDSHIYANHLEQVDEQLLRIPYRLPRLKIKSPAVGKSVFDITIDDLDLIDYHSDPPIKADVAV